MPNGKVMIILFTVALMKKMSHFPELYIRTKSKIRVELNLSNYATKCDLKNVADADTSKLAENGDLASLKPDIDDEDIDKSKTVLV